MSELKSASDLTQSLTSNQLLIPVKVPGPCATLQQWLEIFDQPYEQLLSPSNSTVIGEVMQRRYGPTNAAADPSTTTTSTSTNDLIHERYDVYHHLLHQLPSHGFRVDHPISFVASPGRDRLFLGHTDLQGLGGFTFDCATKEELLCVAQRTEDGLIHLQNSDEVQFPPIAFPIKNLLETAEQLEEKFGTKVYQSTWCGYVQAAFTYMLCEKFSEYQTVRESLGLTLGSSQQYGLRFYVTSTGRLKLSHAGGISSSAALTGAISMATCQLFPRMRSFPLNLLAQIDYGEYFLGKMAGAADKMAQLYAIKNSITMISSLPEALIRIVNFPTEACKVLICTAPIPRLTMHGLSESFLKNRGYSPDHIDKVLKYAEEVMTSFGSVSYVVAVDVILEGLKNASELKRVGITEAEAHVLRTALMTHPPLSFSERPNTTVAGSSSTTTSASSTAPPTPCTYPRGLLRELCRGGSIEQIAPDLAGPANELKRYHLYYRMLKLLPEKYVHVTCQKKVMLLQLRKAALYGLSEVERGWSYLNCLDQIQAIKQQSTTTPSTTPLDQLIEPHINRILELASLCHDGDRAVVDYRHLLPEAEVPSIESVLAGARYAPGADQLPPPPCSFRFFRPTPWASSSRNDVSDARVDEWLESITPPTPTDSSSDPSSPTRSSQLLSDLPGGFERSIIDIDEMADTVDELHQRYQHSSDSSNSTNSVSRSKNPSSHRRYAASLRISAAGLGGRVCVHARPEVSHELETYLVGQGWEVRVPIPSAPTQTIQIVH